jgi:hypothetical protein
MHRLNRFHAFFHPSVVTCVFPPGRDRVSLAQRFPHAPQAGTCLLEFRRINVPQLRQFRRWMKCR